MSHIPVQFSVKFSGNSSNKQLDMASEDISPLSKKIKESIDKEMKNLTRMMAEAALDQKLTNVKNRLIEVA